MTGDHVREELGGYLLGALDPPEADHVRLHLERCEACRREHDRLAAAGRALPFLQRPQEALPTLPPTLETDVIRGLRRESNWRARTPRGGWWGALGRLRGGRGALGPLGRWSALAGAFAGCAATLAVLALAGEFSGGPEPVQTVALSSPGSSARADARLSADASGTQVRLRIRGLAPTRPGEIYEVWLVRDDGRVSAGTFTAEAGDELRLTLTTAARPAAYDLIGITREPDALDPGRNGPNVLAGRLHPTSS